MADIVVLDYRDVAPEAKSNLLLGNGFSRSLHDGFKYGSLKEAAEKAGLIGEEVRRLFDLLGTADFEQVLSRLVEARVVNEAHNINNGPLERSHDATRDALAQVVSLTHPARKELDDKRLGHYRRVLRTFDRIFTTNYDLLLYWIAALGDGLREFRDFFWSREQKNGFDPKKSTGSQGPTYLYYLHGALFLQRRDDHVYKVKRERGAAGSDLLTTLRKALEAAAPVFVSEGAAAAKRRAIAHNEYLEWTYGELEKLNEGIVVFGHSLSKNDEHILAALCRNPRRPVAVGIFAATAKERRRLAGSFAERFAALDKEEGLEFFDSTTFPLLGGFS